MGICLNCLNHVVDSQECAIPLNVRYRKNYQLDDNVEDFGYTKNKPLPECYFYIFQEGSCTPLTFSEWTKQLLVK
jgi:hypothetical protein